MKIRKLLTGFSRFADAFLLAFAKAIVAAMTGNLNFPTPQPSLATVGTGITEFEDAMSASAEGGITETIIKNQKREALIALLKQLANYITLVAGDDESKLSSSGFFLSKEPGPIGPLPKPEDFKVRPAEKGQLKISVKPIYGARLYRLEYRLTTEPVWMQLDSTSSKILLTDLESGKEYVCRILPCGASEVRTYSDQISSFVN
jgi:hypothetical protein